MLCLSVIQIFRSIGNHLHIGIQKERKKERKEKEKKEKV